MHHVTLRGEQRTNGIAVNDATILLRDIAGDAATKAASKVNPSDDQLAQIDRPAEDNTWHEVPDVQGYKEQMRSKVPIGKKDAKEAAGDATAAAHPDGSRDPADAADRAANEGSQAVDPKTGAKAGAQNLQQKFSDRMDEDQKEKLRQYRERTNKYFKGKFPEERRDQVIFRLKKMVVEIQTHQDCRSSYVCVTNISLTLTCWTDQQAVETLLRLAEEYGGHSKNLAQQGHGSAKGATNQDSVQVAQADLKVC